MRQGKVVTKGTRATRDSGSERVDVKPERSRSRGCKALQTRVLKVDSRARRREADGDDAIDEGRRNCKTKGRKMEGIENGKRGQGLSCISRQSWEAV
jgi:hypothetical protein